MSYKLPLALIALAVIMLVGCKQPIGVPSEVYAATTDTVYCTTDGINRPTGHFDLYQVGPLSNQVILTWDTTEITRSYYSGEYGAYPRELGACVFTIPAFDCSGTPYCTLYYYQDAHSGNADLLVNAWWIDPSFYWPPYPSQASYYEMFMTIWNSTDTVATDVTHEDDDCWYAVPLSDWACEAIAESAEAYLPNGSCSFFTGWVYSGTSDGTYTDVSGTYASNPPYIKVVYSD
jgi:hypothetical protein